MDPKREHHLRDFILFFFTSFHSDLLLSHSPDSEILIFDWVPGLFSFPKTLFTSLWDRAVSFLGDIFFSHGSNITELSNLFNFPT